MRTYLDCYPCFVRQALEAARFAGATTAQQREVMHQTLELMLALDPAATPPEIGDQIHRMVRRVTGQRDPYREAKRSSTEQALALYPRLKALLAAATDPLDVAVRLSIAGNIIDLGAAQTYDLWGTIERVLDQPYAIGDEAAFRAALAQAQKVLYLADNAGETVFDRLLIETLSVPVTYAVKGGPTLNDATREDAVAAGLDKVAVITDSGVDAAGTILSRCSAEFRQLYADADVIIAKGQANYESLSPGDSRLFFLLQVKCPVIGRDLGVPAGSIVLKRGGEEARG